jgi:hypothetical protein
MKWLAIAPLMRFLLPVALTVVLLTGSAAHGYRAIGAGTDLCDAWKAGRRQPLGSGSLQDERVLGFLSGIGYEGEEVIDPLMSLDAQAVWAWVDDYCQAHPLEKIAAAAEAFSYEHPR